MLIPHRQNQGGIGHAYILLLHFPCMRYLLLLGMVLFLASFVVAASIDWDAFDCTNLTYDGLSLATSSIPLPPDVGKFLEGESINLHVSGASGPYVSGKVDNGQLHSLKCKMDTTASFDISTGQSSLQQLADSSNPMKTLKQFLSNGNIIIVPYSPMAYIKLFFLNVALAFI